MQYKEHHKAIDYDRARSLIIERLKRDKSLHEQGLYEKMGESDDDFDREFPGGSSDLMLAWTFWDAWIAECNQGFSNIYSGITKDSWPKLVRLQLSKVESVAGDTSVSFTQEKLVAGALAGHVIGQLEKRASITDPDLLAHFDFLEQKSGGFQKWKNFLISLKIFS